MKKINVNFSLPAILSFSADNTNENERFSRGKLEVFYEGETADHRLFKPEFAQELIKSLPYTPIVSYYDEEADDFVGHATEQAIYGIVDPCGEITFTEHDGQNWCVCNTIMYTERPDKVGEIAKKIEGHSQSLELDPDTVKYTINYDERRHFKNIEFTAGKFIGVSVLGKDQKPAFTGSHFFSCDEFEEKMKILRDYCKSQHDQPTGGKLMNLQEFMKLSWGDISVKVGEALAKEYENEAYIYVADMFEDSAIVHWYSYIDGSHKLMRVKYTLENDVVTLGEVNEVHITYEDIVTPSTEATIDETGVEQATETAVMSEENSETISDATTVDESTVVTPVTEPTLSTEVNAEDEKTDDENKEAKCATKEEKTEETEEVEKKEEEPENCAKQETEESESTDEPNKENEEDPNKCSVVDAEPNLAQVSNAEVTEQTAKVSVENEQDKVETSSTSFAESERAELENLKREKKVNLINSYVEILTEEEVADFTSKVDSFNFEELELVLLRKHKAYSDANRSKPMRAFTLNAPTQKSVDPLENFIKAKLGR